jgi:hypothetical protein
MLIRSSFDRYVTTPTLTLVLKTVSQNIRGGKSNRPDIFRDPTGNRERLVHYNPSPRMTATSDTSDFQPNCDPNNTQRQSKILQPNGWPIKTPRGILCDNRSQRRSVNTSQSSPARYGADCQIALTTCPSFGRKNYKATNWQTSREV